MDLSPKRDAIFAWVPSATIWSATALAVLATGDAGAADLEQARGRALELVNVSREANGLPALSEAPATSQAAMTHAADMARRGYYAHTSPDGRTVKDRYEAAGGSSWRLTAENIARCAECDPPLTIEAVERLHEGWMNSPGHRANILARGLTTFGFGAVVDAKDGLYAVQTFAGPGVPRGLEEGEEATSLSHREQGEYAATRASDARQEGGYPAIAASGVLSEAARFALADDEGTPRDLEIGNVLDRLPPSERQNWRSVASLAAACGGCGTHATDADIRYFMKQWLENPEHRKLLLDPRMTHLGFAIRVNGDGRKIGLAILGDRR